MSYYKKIVGETVYLSPLCPDDVELYTKWMNDSSVTLGTGSFSQIFTQSKEADWLASNAGNQNFAIVRLEDDTLLGNCGLVECDHLHQTATVGIFIGEEENRSKGYGREALSLLLDFGFQFLNLRNIMLCVFSFNERAIHMYQKVGFREIGRRRQCHFSQGKFYDTVYMDILRDDFFSENQ